MKKILLVGIGPARCMSTWFVEELTKLENIYAMPRKELDMLDKKNFKTDEYYKLFLSKKYDLFIDYSVGYTLSLKTVIKNSKLISKKYGIKIKFLFLYRDPIHRFNSHLYFYHYRNNISLESIPYNERSLLLKSSLYNLNLENIEIDDNFIFINFIDENFEKNLQSLKKFLKIEKLILNKEKIVGDFYEPKFYLIEKIRQKTFNIFAKYNLDFLIKLLKISKIPSFIKSINNKKETKKFILKKNEIKMIKTDYYKFIKLIR